MQTNMASGQMVLMHTLVQACLRGVPSEVEAIARDEDLAPHAAARTVARGRIVIPANPVRPHRLCAIGEGCRVRVNVNVGTSGVRCDEDLEVEKAKTALREGADTLMDLSTAGDLARIRRRILELDAPVGTVPVYEAVRRAGSAADVDADLLFNVIREHCKQGVDFLTLHCGVNLDALASLKADPRVMGVVSRGGAFHVAMMAATGEENPLYAEYDYLLEILAEHDVVASLGDGMRPGALVDAGRLAKSTEYLTLGHLAKRALAAGVQRMIEGPGHIPADQIGCNVRMLKELTDSAPLYLLGPLVTDVAPGYDHLVGAIGGVIACMNGADFLCMVSPSEHLALPEIRDIVEGTRAARIAAHVGSLSRAAARTKNREIRMAEARRVLDWEKQFELALIPDEARRIRERDSGLETCSMCGDLCAVKMMREILPLPEEHLEP
jgi:phosphomethylpyrimidine synthase